MIEKTLDKPTNLSNSIQIDHSQLAQRAPLIARILLDADTPFSSLLNILHPLKSILMANVVHNPQARCENGQGPLKQAVPLSFCADTTSGALQVRDNIHPRKSYEHN